MPTPIQAEQTSQVEVPQDNLNDNLLLFQNARIHLTRIVDDWKREIEDTNKRRRTRDVDVDVEALRQRSDSGSDPALDEDETLVPVRVIDTNIQREQPAYINYLKNSRRIATFNSLVNPEQDTQKLEYEFTRGMTYTGWEIPHYKCIDGAQTHGWDAVEVTFDESKPLNVGIEHIGHDNLFFPRSAIDIQFSPRIVRRYDVTLSQLDKFVARNKFNAEQVELIRRKRINTEKENETIYIYKVFFKKEGQVFVAWFHLESGVSDWLLAPQPLDLGIKEKQQQPNPLTGQVEEVWVAAPVTMYNIFILPYRETEKPKIVDHKGRVFLDGNKQEAQTAILSGFINGLTRASNIYCSPAQEDGTGSSLKDTGIKLPPGRILSKPVNFWHPDYPDPMVLRALQYFDTANAQETNQPTFAVMNREDSRKTAREISLAESEKQLLNSVQLTMFSTYVRAVYSFAWLIVQSQAMQDKIKFLLKAEQQPVMNPVLNQPMTDETGQPMTQTVYVNDYAVISQIYEVRAAGDVDVIQRQEKIQQMMQDWPVIQSTPLKDRFLQDLIKLKYPDVGEQYAGVLAQGDVLTQCKQLVAQLGTVMAGMMEQCPEMMKTLNPQEQANVQAMMTQATTIAQQLQTDTQQQQQPTAY
jgi:hypothetical protein